MILLPSNVAGRRSDRGQEGATPMPSTSSGKVRGLESTRKARRSASASPTEQSERRGTKRAPRRVQIIAAESAMAGRISGSKRTSNGGRGSDLTARLLSTLPAETLVTLTPGHMVRITREFAELSQAELAAKAGLTQATVSSIESGRATLGLERAKRLAKAMAVHPASLLFPNDL